MSSRPRRACTIGSPSVNLHIPAWVRKRGRCIYCPKHNCGPLDTWYDCDTCSGENPGDVPANPYPAAFAGARITEKELDDWCAFQRKLDHRHYKVATILTKIPREKALSWLDTFNPRRVAAELAESSWACAEQQATRYAQEKAAEEAAWYAEERRKKDLLEAEERRKKERAAERLANPTLENRILCFFEAHAHLEIGASVAECAAGLQMETDAALQVLRDKITDLIDGGYIYTTIDDLHMAATP